jgi:hypothetical protein
MTSNEKPKTCRKKTPADATPFEREQLRFFLTDDFPAMLLEFNPSLAWLPVFSEMKLIQSEMQLIEWIERNFAEIDAVRDVVANIGFFGPETANPLEFRLTVQAKNLPPLLVESSSLIFRHMRTATRGFAQHEWFEIAPQLKRGNYSAAVLERLANALRPKLKVGKRLRWRDTADENVPERPSDLMSIDFEVYRGVSPDEVLRAWPNNAMPEIDESLLSQLTAALTAALADATDVGVESNEGGGTSDLDVPSVARHPQNAYRNGFQAIVRVIAEIWTRLAAKSPAMALTMAERWRDSRFRLMRRLALFAFTDPAMPAELAADILIGLPLGELFLTSSSVEVFRLIRERWNDLPAGKQQQILRRLCQGPPRTWFRKDAEIDRHIDSNRFNILSEMVRNNFDIGLEAKNLLADIRTRWPQWQLPPAEQAGFHFWFESGTRERSETADKLKGVADADLVAEAKKIAAASAFMEPDSWQGLCLSDPDRALRGLDAAAGQGDWPKEYWEQLLWSQKTYADAGTEQKIAQLLLEWPHDDFDTIAAAASSWLHGHAKTLSDQLVWSLWDRVAEATMIKSVEAGDA